MALPSEAWTRPCSDPCGRRRGLLLQGEKVKQTALLPASHKMGPSSRTVGIAFFVPRLAIIRARSSLVPRLATIRARSSLASQCIHQSAHVERSLSSASAIADRLRLSGDNAGCCRVLSEVVAGLRELHGSRHPDTIYTIASLAQVLSRAGGDAAIVEAEALAREAWDSAQKALGSDHPDAALTRATLSQVLVRRGALGEAEVLMRACHQAATVAAAAFKTASLDVQITSSNLAQVLIQQDRLDDAKPFAYEAYQSSLDVLGAAHAHTLDELGSLGPLLEATGDEVEAEAVMRTHLQTCRNVHGASHPETLIALSSLARLLACRTNPPSGTLSEAEALMREDLEASRTVHGNRHVDTLAAVSNLAQLLYMQRRYSEALPLAQEAVSMSEQRLRGDSTGLTAHRRELQDLLASIEPSLPA